MIDPQIASELASCKEICECDSRAVSYRSFEDDQSSLAIRQSALQDLQLTVSV